MCCQPRLGTRTCSRSPSEKWSVKWVMMIHATTSFHLVNNTNNIMIITKVHISFVKLIPLLLWLIWIWFEFWHQLRDDIDEISPDTVSERAAATAGHNILTPLFSLLGLDLDWLVLTWTARVTYDRLHHAAMLSPDSRCRLAWHRALSCTHHHHCRPGQPAVKVES